MRAVITVVGKDTVGICAMVSNFCAENNVNIDNISQTVLDDMFCMIMSVNVDNCTLPFGILPKKFQMPERQRVLSSMRCTRKFLTQCTPFDGKEPYCGKHKYGRYS